MKAKEWRLIMVRKLLAFSFARTSEEASGETTGQAAGLGQGSMLREALSREYYNQYPDNAWCDSNQVKLADEKKR